GGSVLAYDSRAQAPAAILDVTGGSTRLSSVSSSGLRLAVGVSDGTASLYDIRSPVAVTTHDHKQGTPVHSVEIHSSGRVISGDETSIRCWNDDGSLFFAVQTPKTLSHVTHYPGTSLLIAPHSGVLYICV
ncbi:hypothetical protein KIPB_012837, partial [Kipferlia bialata]